MGHALGMVSLMRGRDAPTPSKGTVCGRGQWWPGSGLRASQSTAPEPTGREEGDPSQGSVLFKASELLMAWCVWGKIGGGEGRSRLEKARNG